MSFLDVGRLGEWSSFEKTILCRINCMEYKSGGGTPTVVPLYIVSIELHGSYTAETHDKLTQLIFSDGYAHKTYREAKAVLINFMEEAAVVLDQEYHYTPFTAKP